MPSAAPVPRGPSVLLLGSADELLKRGGCPVCRYAAEASESYLSWFALEGHGDVDMLNGLLAARGMCPAHTRRLLVQPGSPVRLTAVYRYVLEAAIRDLGAGTRRRAGCPACEHDAAAEDRVLDIVLEDLTPGGDRRYESHGGLCAPHVRSAALRCKRADADWLTRVLSTQISARPGDVGLLAGGPDPDAAARAALRAALPDLFIAGRARACPVCWATARAEDELLAITAEPVGRPTGQSVEQCLCARHLHDAAFAAGASTTDLLGWQAGCQQASLAGLRTGRSRRDGRASWLRVRRRDEDAGLGCPICRHCHQAAAHALDRYRQVLQAATAGDQPVLCLRHVDDLLVIDPAGGRRAVAAQAEPARRLLEELAESFRKQTWTHRDEPQGAERSAWRRAAGFLDGGVFGGCPAD